MGNNSDILAALGARQPMTVQHQVLTEAQKQEILRVQGMQVRTEAARQATQLVAAGTGPGETWLKVAELIEDYIRGSDPDAAPGARLHPGEPGD